MRALVEQSLLATPYATGDEGPARYRTYLMGSFCTTWEWRFFYLDGGTVFRLAPLLRPRLKTPSDEG